MYSYDPNTAWWPSSWWNSAVAVTTMMDYLQRTGSTSQRWIVDRTFEVNKGVFPAGVKSSDPIEGNFASRAIDDTEWWGIAWIQAYDLTHDAKYLSMAQTIGQYVQGYWDTTCGGGVWWNRERTYKNAITNGLYVRLAAALHNRLLADTTWLGRAIAGWNWFSASGMINASGLVNDGIDSGCHNNGGTVWTYNQGLAMGAALELWRATGDPTQLAAARRLADAAITSSSLSPNGILTESCDPANTCDDNQKQFKGIFMRYLLDLLTATGDSGYRGYAQRQADAIWQHDRDPLNRIGQRWAGATPNAGLADAGERARWSARRLNPISPTQRSSLMRSWKIAAVGTRGGGPGHRRRTRPVLRHRPGGHRRPGQQLVRLRAVRDAGRQQPAGRGRRHGRDRSKSVPIGLYSGFRRLHAIVGRHLADLVGHRGWRADQQPFGAKVGMFRSPSAVTAAPNWARTVAARRLPRPRTSRCSKYSLHAIDFDLEEPEYENDAAVNNELGAAQILQRNNSGLYVSVTMPGTTSGAGYFGTLLLDKSKTLGFTPDNFSIMPFDGGFNGATDQINALESFHGLLESHLGWSSATAYAHEGASLMNGRSDTGEFFRQADFQSVLNYATSHGLARFTFWAVNRDRQCSPPDNNGQTSGVCSSVTQNSWDFTKYSATFAGATPPTSGPSSSPTAPPPPTSAPPGGGCSAAAWSATTTYNGGAVVSYGSHQWTAKWWSYGDIPGGPAGVWADNGAC